MERVVQGCGGAGWGSEEAAACWEVRDLGEEVSGGLEEEGEAEQEQSLHHPLRVPVVVGSLGLPRLLPILIHSLLGRPVSLARR